MKVIEHSELFLQSVLKIQSKSGEKRGFLERRLRIRYEAC